MGHPAKIATCCFCGSKAALVLDAGRHELSCAQCGAPLHDLKQIPVRTVPVRRSRQKRDLRHFPEAKLAKPRVPSKVRRPKSKKSWMRKLAGEVIDLAEDIFD